ncbi:MAG: membrane protein insertion efficiency factor YidD [Clostridia bacterium]|nr:membrane protein insertion efficiency factor YidD [Clostridia bacterium]
MKRKNKVKSFFAHLFLLPVYLYKVAISPLIPHSCIFFPSCSTYMVKAVKEFGVFKGGWIGIKRLFRCNPTQKKRGYDPIPVNIKGESLWIL